MSEHEFEVLSRKELAALVQSQENEKGEHRHFAEFWVRYWGNEPVDRRWRARRENEWPAPLASLSDEEERRYKSYATGYGATAIDAITDLERQYLQRGESDIKFAKQNLLILGIKATNESPTRVGEPPSGSAST